MDSQIHGMTGSGTAIARTAYPCAINPCQGHDGQVDGDVSIWGSHVRQLGRRPSAPLDMVDCLAATRSWWQRGGPRSGARERSVIALGFGAKVRAAKLVHELLPERGAALFEQLGANAQRAARGPVAKSPAAELREHR
jgi:hypothetical protein